MSEKMSLLSPVPVSVIILTLNEEMNLAHCLATLKCFRDIHILDSGSTDATVSIAKERGVSVHVNAFQGFGQQRNWAIDHIPTKYCWQFHLDADERLSPELTSELTEIVSSNPSFGGYLVPSKLMFAGKWLKHAGQYPAYQLRFFHKERIRFIDFGHGQREVTLYPVGRLKNPIVHYGFSKGFEEWFLKHLRYARREAKQSIQGELTTPDGSLLSFDGVSRRRALKRLTRLLPCRYILRLGYLLFIRGAMLDGWAGITYAQMLATYEGMIEVYLRLLRHGVDL